MTCRKSLTEIFKIFSKYLKRIGPISLVFSIIFGIGGIALAKGPNVVPNFEKDTEQFMNLVENSASYTWNQFHFFSLASINLLLICFVAVTVITHSKNNRPILNEEVSMSKDSEMTETLSLYQDRPYSALETKIILCTLIFVFLCEIVASAVYLQTVLTWDNAVSEFCESQKRTKWCLLVSVIKITDVTSFNALYISAIFGMIQSLFILIAAMWCVWVHYYNAQLNNSQLYPEAKFGSDDKLFFGKYGTALGVPRETMDFIDSDTIFDSNTSTTVTQRESTNSLRQ